ncbi:glycoside hydrolase family 43 protein [Marivirga lumbricoides]
MMKFRKVIVRILVPIVFLVSACQVNPESKSEEADDVVGNRQTYYQNPILAGWYPDPAITDDGKGNFYMVHSTFAFYPGIPIFHSTDLVNWKQIGHVLERPEQLDLEGFGVSRAIFAPDISYDNGIFYVTCTVVDGQGNFVVTATDPAGEWSNPVYLPKVIGIDPGLFFDEDKTYLVYNSDAPDNKPLYQGHRTIRMVEFDKENLKVISEDRILVNGGVDISTKPIWAEGPRIYKLNGYYYLMTAEGGTAVNHSEMIYRTKDINDDFIPYKDNPILTQRSLDPGRKHPITSAGHADLIQHPNGNWYGVFLACRDYDQDHYNTGRETFMAPVKWVNDWPVFDLEGEEIRYKYDLPEGVLVDTTLFPLNGNFSFTDSFEDSLGYHWYFLRTVKDPWYSVGEKLGFLTLETRPETISGESNPSFIAHRQQHQKFSAEVSLAFKPTDQNEKAGIVAFQNETHYYFLALAQEKGKMFVQVLKGGDDGEELVASKELETDSDGLIRLKISSDVTSYAFHFATDNDNWELLKEGLDSRYLSTREAGGFVGVSLAMYTSSYGKESEARAHFGEFTYSGNDAMFK